MLLNRHQDTPGPGHQPTQMSTNVSIKYHLGSSVLVNVVLARTMQKGTNCTQNYKNRVKNKKKNIKNNTRVPQTINTLPTVDSCVYIFFFLNKTLWHTISYN